MLEQYVEAAGEERFEAAVSLTRRLLAEDHAVRLEEAAATAVLQAFCLCVTAAEDEIEHHLSSVHAGLVAEVVRRVRTDSAGAVRPVGAARHDRRRGARRPPQASSERSATRAVRAPLDAVNLASDESFPASDPPAWIERR